MSYPVTVKEVNGKFFVACQTFCLVTESNTLADAYAKLLSLRQASIERYKKAELPLPPTESNHHSNATLLNKNRFSLTKAFTLAVIVAVLGISAPLLTSLSALSRNMMKGIEKFGQKYDQIANAKNIPYFLSRVAAILEETTPQRKEEIRQNLKIIAKELRPFTSELQPVLITQTPHPDLLNQELRNIIQSEVVIQMQKMKQENLSQAN